MKFKTWCTAVFLISSRLAPCFAQAEITISPTAKAAEFDVASVHPAKEGTAITSISPANSKSFYAHHVTLRFLIAIAYGLDSDHILGKMSWLDQNVYDIEGKISPERTLTDDQLRPMLQALLKQRFALQCHLKDEKQHGYALLASKDVSKLHKASDTLGTPMILPNRIIGTGVSMQELAGILARPLGRPVADQTSLDGFYAIDLTFAPQNEPESPLPSIVTALKEQYGLVLVNTVLPVTSLIIDAANPLPTAN